MINELRDLDGNIIARARSEMNETPAHLILTSTDNGGTFRLDGLDAVQTLRDLCDTLLADSTED